MQSPGSGSLNVVSYGGPSEGFHNAVHFDKTCLRTSNWWLGGFLLQSFEVFRVERGNQQKAELVASASDVAFADPDDESPEPLVLEHLEQVHDCRVVDGSRVQVHRQVLQTLQSGHALEHREHVRGGQRAA